MSSNFRRSVHLREVISSWSFKKVSASAYKSCPLTAVCNCRVSVENSPRLQFWCPLMGGVCKQRFDCTILFSLLNNKLFIETRSCSHATGLHEL